jgi:hypothetical protein
MIADDTGAIRKALDHLNWQKRIIEAEQRLKAKQGDKTPPAELPEQKPLLDEPGPPFRGFFFTDGTQAQVRPRGSNFDLDEYEQAWDEWDDATLDSGVTAETASLFFWGKLD